MSRIKLGLLVAVTALSALALGPAGASAEFGIAKWDGSVTAEGGTPYTQAGGHPFSTDTTVELNSHPNPEIGGFAVPDEPPSNILTDLPPGLIGNTTPFLQCEAGHLLLSERDGANGLTGRPVPEANPEKLCPIGSIVGIVYVNDGGALFTSPIYNMVPPTGVAARFGFNVFGVLIAVDGSVRESGEFHVATDSRNISEALPLLGARLVFWGSPYDKVHDQDRCWTSEPLLSFGEAEESPLCDEEEGVGAPHSVAGQAIPLLRMPTRCTASGEGLRFDAAADSWQHLGVFDTASFLTHEPEPNQATQVGTENCGVVPSDPQIKTTPTSKTAETPSGLDVELKVPSDGLLNPDGVGQSDLKKVEVTLPQGMTINPSQAEGLGTCSPAQYAAETVQGEPGSGCPSTSKIGTVEVDTPVLSEPIPGNLYVATEHDNPFNSLLALYVVAKDPVTGVQIKAAGEVKPDPKTGQLTTVFDNLPQAPFERFLLHFREGQRSPLSTPPLCGTFTTVAKFTPWATPETVIERKTSFEVDKGVHDAPCPSGNTPPFHPGLIAGSINNRAGSYSPFYARLTRDDGEQEMTHFSIKLPPGLSGKLAGIPLCSDAAIEAAKARTGPLGGTEEEEHPSCPVASEVGHTLVGAGVGGVQVYAPGKVYLAGPYHGSAISLAAITAAKVGPFDLGTVVVRQALRVNPETAEVFVDATGSDPIPHIIQGIPTHVRDIRVYVDRPNFTLDPTSCEKTSTASTLLGSGLDFGSEADDQPVTVSTPYQAADCAALGFKPKLTLKLKGSMKRGGNPALHAVFRPGPNNANAQVISVALPHSEFLDQGHLNNVCTRVQFNSGAGNGTGCPSGSIYGTAKAVTPILDEPLQGNVYLRSSEHKLPDVVLALHSGRIDIDAVGRIDSTKGGGIRTTFEAVPDAPVTEVVVDFGGGDKSLLENSTSLCKGTNRAVVKMAAHNGKGIDLAPVLKASSCHGKAAKKHKRHR
jgi:hypothetical protein